MLQGCGAGYGFWGFQKVLFRGESLSTSSPCSGVLSMGFTHKRSAGVYAEFSQAEGRKGRQERQALGNGSDCAVVSVSLSLDCINLGILAKKTSNNCLSNYFVSAKSFLQSCQKGKQNITKIYNIFSPNGDKTMED